MNCILLRLIDCFNGGGERKSEVRVAYGSEEEGGRESGWGWEPRELRFENYSAFGGRTEEAQLL